MEHGLALIAARNKAGLTQKELSARSKIAQGDISRIENGDANPSIKTLKKLAQGLGMKVTISYEPLEV